LLRIFAGDFVTGEMAGKQVGQSLWLLTAAIMVIPIIMVVLILLMPHSATRWSCVVVAGLWIIFNLAGLPYKGWYDNFLIAVSIVFCGAIIWYAWTWQAPA
jgi:hypothetical protein